MPNQRLADDSPRFMPGNNKTECLEQLLSEFQETPSEYWPNLLQLVRLFRESVTLKPAEASLCQAWQEAMMGQTLPVSQLWQGIDAD